MLPPGAPSSPGDYRDAVNKGHAVTPFIMEALGGVGRHGIALLKRLARDADSLQGLDRYRYVCVCVCVCVCVISFYTCRVNSHHWV